MDRKNTLKKRNERTKRAKRTKRTKRNETKVVFGSDLTEGGAAAGKKIAVTGLALNTLGSVLDVADLASMATTLAVVGAGATVGLLPLALPIIARKYRKHAVKDGKHPGPLVTKLQQVAEKMSKKEKITDSVGMEMERELEAEQEKISQDPEREDLAALIHDTILRQNKTNQDLADFSEDLVDYATRMVKLENHMGSVQNKTNKDLADFSEKLVNYATRMVKLENHKGSVLNFLDVDALSSHLRQHELLHYYDGLVSLGIIIPRETSPS